jgi:hypothetical protein
MFFGSAISITFHLLLSGLGILVDKIKNIDETLTAIHKEHKNKNKG